MFRNRHRPPSTVSARTAFLCTTILCLLLLIFSGLLQSGSAEEVEELAEKLDRRLMSGGLEIPVPAQPDWTKEKGRWEEVISGAATRPWTFARRPELRVEVIETRRAPEKLLLPPVIQNLEQEAYEVTVHWENDPRTTAKITGYNVYRRVGDSARPSSPLNTRPLPADTHEYLDQDDEVLRPMTRVHYAVEALSETGSLMSSPTLIDLPDDRSVLYYGNRHMDFAVVGVRRFRGGAFHIREFKVFLGDKIRCPAAQEHGQLDFSTDHILTYIGREIVESRTIKKEPLLSSTGAKQYGPAGQLITVDKVIVKKREQKFIELGDARGNLTRILATTRPRPAVKRPELLPETADAVSRRIRELEISLFDLRKSGASFNQADRLRGRIRELRKSIRNILDPKTRRVRGLHLIRLGALKKLRWAFLEANERVRRHPGSAVFRRNALKLYDRIFDLEALLSPEEQKIEEEEWEKDRRRFEER